MYKEKKVLAIVQARMESERFPGKVLKLLAGKPVLQWILERLKQSLFIDRIALAIPASEQSKQIINEWRTRGWNEYCTIFSGDMDNVIKRVLDTSSKIKIDYNSADILVDITADCPLVDPRHVDFLIKELIDNDFDYYSNVVTRSWPDGCDIQVYKTDILASTYLKIKNETHKKHVGWNILQYSSEYKIGNHMAPPLYYYPEMRLTLDTEQDYIVLNEIFQTFKDFGCFYIEDVIGYMVVNPALRKINSEIKAKIPGEG